MVLRVLPLKMWKHAVRPLLSGRSRAPHANLALCTALAKLRLLLSLKPHPNALRETGPLRASPRFPSPASVTTLGPAPGCELGSWVAARGPPVPSHATHSTSPPVGGAGTGRPTSAPRGPSRLTHALPKSLRAPSIPFVAPDPLASSRESSLHPFLHYPPLAPQLPVA